MHGNGSQSSRVVIKAVRVEPHVVYQSTSEVVFLGCLNQFHNCSF